MPANLLRLLISACVTPILTFAAETWWPPPNKPRRQTSSRAKALNSALRIAMLAALSVYRKTPTSLLHHSLSLCPADISLDTAVKCAAIRYSQLDDMHPIPARQRLLTRPENSNLSCIFALPPAPVEKTNRLFFAPWFTPRTRGPEPATGSSKKDKAASFLRWQRTRSGRDMWVYTDGSKQEDGHTGAGWVVSFMGNTIATDSRPSGRHTEVLDAEAEAVRQGVHATCTHPYRRYANNLWVCLDNRAVVDMLYSRPTHSSQQALCQASHQLGQWPHRIRLREFQHLSGGTAHALWIPSHSGIAGNEKADSLARAAASQPAGDHTQEMSLAAALRWLCLDRHADFCRYWAATAPRALALPPPLIRVLKALSLSRPILARILAARSGHEDFADYHEQFHHLSATLRCRCGARTTPLHFFDCRIGGHRSLLHTRNSGPPPQANSRHNRHRSTHARGLAYRVSILRSGKTLARASKPQLNPHRSPAALDANITFQSFPYA